MTSASLSYRPDLDGLRAVAVGSVVLYHAKLGAPGGFVGVDVFFVLSGYLITSLLLKEWRATGRIDLVSFWERRIRRIFPALFSVVIVTFGAGWFLLLPADYAKLGKAVALLTYFSSNFFFWREANYFDLPNTESSPLLQTWSLSVEEQFYLVFPILLYGILKRGLKPLIVLLCVASLFSLILSEYAVRRHPAFAFYLLPTRAWELGLGAIIAWTALHEGIKNRWLCETMSALGILAILYCIFFYSSATTFPGLSAILPTVGAGLYIYFNQSQSTVIARLFSARPIVFVGLISYSLYLWHWPILAYVNYISLEPSSLVSRLLMILLSVLLATLSWKFIETPFRKVRNSSPRAKLFLVVALCALFLFGLGSAVMSMGGLRARLSEKALFYADSQFDMNSEMNVNVGVEDAQRGEFLRMGDSKKNHDERIDLLIWGDSHAKALIPVLEELCEEYSVSAVAAVHDSTPPLLNFVIPGERTGLRDQSPVFAASTLNYIIQKKIKSVLLISRWGVSCLAKPEFHFAFLNTVNALKNAGVDVWVMKDVPLFPWSVPGALARTEMIGGSISKLNIPVQSYLDQLVVQESVFRSASDIHILSPAPYLTENGAMVILWNGYPVYRDKHHLSLRGSALLKPMFEPLFQSLRQKVATGSWSRFLRSHPFQEYRSADLFSPRAHNKINLRDMPIYASDSVDAFLCFHMLEHVADDRRAIAEPFRILKPGEWKLSWWRFN